MPRSKITAEQRILDLFAEMHTEAQAGIIVKLAEMHRCFVKRDKAMPPKDEAQGKLIP